MDSTLLYAGAFLFGAVAVFGVFWLVGGRSSDDDDAFSRSVAAAAARGGKGGKGGKGTGAAKEKVEPRDFTLEELAAFQGEDDAPIYVGINGDVYDVSEKAESYGPGTGYSIFTGRDSALHLACAALGDEQIPEGVKGIKDLSAEQLDSLRSWIEFFDGHYTVVGRIVDDKGNHLKVNLAE